jgi:Flp pilus assembly protein TadG
MKTKFFRSQKSPAQAMVEFALILPILLLVVYGLLEVGRLLFIYSSVVSAARQAARYGSTTGIIATGSTTPRYRDCAGMRTSAQRVGFIQAITDSDIEIWHDEGEGVKQVSYCPPGQTVDSTNFQPSTGNVNRIRVRVSIDYAPILPIVPLGPFPIESVSARTVLVSVPIVITAAPQGWEPPAPPPPPVDFTKSSPDNGATNQATSVTLAWSASSGATSYEVCYDATNDNACSSWVDNGTSTSMPISNLATGATYYWHVRALNTSGTTYSNGSSTAFWSFTVSALPPSPPADFAKSSPSNGATNQSTSITLSWTASSGATSYEGCYDTTNDNACSSWVNIGLSTSIQLNNLAIGTTYYWHVRAVNASGTTYSNGSSTAFWSFTTSATPPLPPADFTKSSPANGATNQSTSITLSWTVSSGATSYEACYDTTNDNACSSWVNVGSSTSMLLSNLATSTTYYWHVRAVNTSGTTYSNASSTAFWSFTTSATPPTTACSISHSTLKIIVTDPQKVSMTLQNDAVSILTIHVKTIVVNYNNGGGNGIQDFSIIPDSIWSGNQTGTPLTINVANPNAATFTFAPNVSKIFTATFKKNYTFAVGDSFVITFVEPECPVVTVTQ